MSFYCPFVPAITPFASNELNTLINLLDEPVQRRHRRAVPTFTPRFDIKETKTGYELHGELPGIEQKDIDIEWSEGTNLTIRGRTEYTRSEGTTPKAEEPKAEEPKPAEEDGWTSVSETEKHDNSHKATVEDAPEPGEASTAVATAEPEKKEVAKAEAPKPTSKYWISERSVGSFRRTFQFPVPVDHDNVRATLKNGVLSVTVPKIEPRVHRIRIE